MEVETVVQTTENIIVDDQPFQVEVFEWHNLSAHPKPNPTHRAIYSDLPVGTPMRSVRMINPETGAIHELCDITHSDRAGQILHIATMMVRKWQGY